MIWSYLITIFILFLSFFHMGITSQYLMFIELKQRQFKEITVTPTMIDTTSSEIYGYSQNATLILADTSMDTLLENCMQAIIQICLTLKNECGSNITNSAVLWGWALSLSSGNTNLLEPNVDYTIVNRNGINYIVPAGYINLSALPDTVNPGSCSSASDILTKGRYYYTRYVKMLGCNIFKMDLFDVIHDQVTCSYSDIRY